MHPAETAQRPDPETPTRVRVLDARFLIAGRPVMDGERLTLPLCLARDLESRGFVELVGRASGG